MKKTITITIGKMLFTMEEDAFAALSGYLDSIKAKFAGYPDGSEIVSDIENRIAEHFLKGREDQQKVVTLADVDALIASMGKPEDFAEEAEAAGAEPQSAKEDRGPRKLYRNMEDSLLAGVSSGIAAYFGIEPVIVRMIFIGATILHGFGIIIYLVLWIVTPEAKTATEKLRMKGAPITLESVDTVMKQTAETIRTETGRSRLLRMPIEFMSKVFGLIFKKIVPFFVKFVGVIVSVSAVFALFVLTFVSVVTLFNVHSSYVDFPLRDAISGSLLYITLLAGFIAASVPLVFVLGLGKLLVRGRNAQRGRWGFGLLGIWFIALITLGVSATKIVPLYQDMLDNNPSYRTVTQTFDAADFSKLDVRNGIDVEIKEGSEFRIEADGRERDLARLTVSSTDGTLLLARGVTKDNKICIFCIGGSVHVRVVAPSYESVHAANGSDVDGTGLTSKNFELELENGSQADFEMSTSTEHLVISLKNGSHASMSGGGESADFALQNGSFLDAMMFAANEVVITAQNASHVEVHAIKKLEVHAQNGSSVSYAGTPDITRDLHNGSRINPAESDSSEEF